MAYVIYINGDTDTYNSHLGFIMHDVYCYLASMASTPFIPVRIFGLWTVITFNVPSPSLAVAQLSLVIATVILFHSIRPLISILSHMGLLKVLLLSVFFIFLPTRPGFLRDLSNLGGFCWALFNHTVEFTISFSKELP
jgi:hypothetical protein